MRTFQEAFYLEEGGLAERLARDLRLIGYLLQMIWFWLVLGGRVRRGVRRARREGRSYPIDFLGKESH